MFWKIQGMMNGDTYENCGFLLLGSSSKTKCLSKTDEDPQHFKR